MSNLITTIAAFIFLSLNLSVFGQTKTENENAPELVPYRKGEKWGITDTAGNFVMRPRYKEIRILRTGHFVFKRGKKEALADKNGKPLTPFKYTSISDFGPSQSMKVTSSEVLASIKVNKKKGFLDTLGNEVMPPKYRLAYSLGGGLFSAGKEVPDRPGWNGWKVGLFKTGGIPLTPLSFHIIERKPGGYIQLNDFKSIGIGWANPKGKIILPPKFIDVGALSEGFFSGLMFPDYSPYGKRGYAFFDTTGQMVFNQQFDAIYKTPPPENITFRNGRAAVRDINQKWGYINRKGELVIPYIYVFAQVFNNGYAIVNKDLKANGLIDTVGNVILPFENSLSWDVRGRLTNRTKEDNTVWLDLKQGPDGLKITAYDEFDYFYHNNLIYASQNGKAGYLDMNGNIAIPFEFEKGMRFSDGYAAVKKNGKWGFIDTTGQVKVPFLYDDTKNTTYIFTDGIAAVKLNGKWGYINKNGRAITEFLNYSGSQPRIFENGVVKYWAYKEGDAPYERRHSNFTIIDTTGKRITDLIFTEVGTFENGFAKVCQGKNCGLINSKGKLIVPLLYEFVPSIVVFKTTLSRENSLFHHGLLLVRDPETHKTLGYISKTGKQYWED